MTLQFVVLIVTGLMYIGTLSWLTTVAIDANRTGNIVCTEHRVLAQIAKEEVQELIDNQKKFLRPNVNIPGLSHAELVESSERKIRNKSANLIRLERIAKETC